MSRLMLINGHHAEELRVAIVDDGVLDTYQIEVAEAGLERGNIYRGVVANIEPSLDAAFIDYGNDKHGFLTSHDVVSSAYHKRVSEGQKRHGIQDVLEKGKSVLVQVTRDAVGSKGAALTTNISLPGKYLVMMPFDSLRAVSRKIEDEKERKQLREKVGSLPLPDDYGYIIRTSALAQTKTALKADATALLRLCRRVLQDGKRGKGPRLLYDDQDLVVQALRDYLDPTSIEEVVIDDEQLYQQANGYLQATMPRCKVKQTLYKGRLPLFSRHNLEPQIDSIYQRTVPLDGGGSIVIDHTEALTAIDVNSGKNTRGSNQEETAHKTNVAAADEVARQLRLRNIGGLVVVDFIDMRSNRHRANVEKALRDALKRDKARTKVSRISANGLLEINRQRLRKALVQRMHRICPTCRGVGMLATPELLGLRLLRRIEARAATGRLRKVRVGLHPELADAIQNHRRSQLIELEREFDISIEIVAATHLHRSDEEVEWVDREMRAEPQTANSRTDAPGEARRSKGSRDGNWRRNGPLAAMDTTEFRAVGSAQTPSGDPADPQTAALATGDADRDGEDAAEGDETGNGRSRRRRRRPRRRRKRSAETSMAAEGEAGSESSGPLPGVADVPPDEPPATSPLAAVPTETDASLSRAASQDQPDTAGADGSAENGTTAAADKAGTARGTRRSRSRRRRTPKASTDDNSRASDGARASEAGSEPPAEPKAATDQQSSDDGATAPSSTRRRRSRGGAGRRRSSRSETPTA